MLPNKNKIESNSQSGNVFIIIFLGIFLFGTLIYSFSRSTNQGTGNVTKQQARIVAQEILNYARLIENAVDRVRRNGCSESEINFDNTVITGYANPISPPDQSCDIFEDEGGQAIYTSPPPNSTSLDWFFESGLVVQGLGRSSSPEGNDLALLLPGLNQATCDNINTILNHGFSTTPIDNGDIFEGSDDQFIGTFIDSVDVDILTGHPTDNDCTPTRPLCGKTSACFQEEDGNGYYIFYNVLLAR